MDWKRINSLNSFVCVYETVELESWGTVCVCETGELESWGIGKDRKEQTRIVCVCVCV